MGVVISSQEASSNVKLVMKAIETVFDQHEIGAIDQYFSKEFVQCSPYVPPGGRDELAAWWRHTVDAIPDIRGTIDQVVAAENRVVVFGTLKGTITNDMPEMGLKASNQALEFRVAHLFQVDEGMIVAHREVVDTGPVLKLAHQATTRSG
jgi:predicted SnoaL-like aldol condensation-catalyzing enzyme